MKNILKKILFLTVGYFVLSAFVGVGSSIYFYNEFEKTPDKCTYIQVKGWAVGNKIYKVCK